MRPTAIFGIVFMLIALAFAGVPARAGPQFGAIEIRLVAEQPGTGPVLAVEGGDRVVEVGPDTLLGPGDFVSVGKVEWTEGKPGFDVALSEAGAGKYERISTENVGRTLAIIVDGKILMTPKILDPVRAKGFLLTVNDEAEAAALAAGIERALAAD